MGWKGYRVHRDHIFQVKNVNERIEKVGLPLPERVSACDNEVMLGIHIIDERRVGIPSLNKAEIDRVQDVDIAVLGCSADVPTSFHDHVVIFGWYLTI